MILSLVRNSNKHLTQRLALALPIVEICKVICITSQTILLSQLSIMHNCLEIDSTLQVQNT
jgi:hypothetical protein